MRELARAFTTEAVTTLVEVMKRGKSEGARIAAANTLLERGWGRPIAPIEHTGRDGGPIETAIVSARSVIAERLAALASRSEEDTRTEDRLH